MNDDAVKRVVDHVAAGGSALTSVAYYAEALTPILTCAVLIITFAWYVMRFIDRARGKVAGDE